MKKQRQEDKVEIDRLNKVILAMAILFIKKAPHIVGANTLPNKIKYLIKVCEKDVKGCKENKRIEMIKYFWNLR